MKMKLTVLVIALVFACAPIAYAGSAYGPKGPAPNSGDGVPDGSGFEKPYGPNGASNPGTGTGPVGPAPNSGDCIPDGSGFDWSGDPLLDSLF